VSLVLQDLETTGGVTPSFVSPVLWPAAPPPLLHVQTRLDRLLLGPPPPPGLARSPGQAPGRPKSCTPTTASTAASCPSWPTRYGTPVDRQLDRLGAAGGLESVRRGQVQNLKCTSHVQLAALFRLDINTSDPHVDKSTRRETSSPRPLQVSAGPLEYRQRPAGVYIPDCDSRYL